VRGSAQRERPRPSATRHEIPAELKSYGSTDCNDSVTQILGGYEAQCEDYDPSKHVGKQSPRLAKSTACRRGHSQEAPPSTSPNRFPAQPRPTHCQSPLRCTGPSGAQTARASGCRTPLRRIISSPCSCLRHSEDALDAPAWSRRKRFPRTGATGQPPAYSASLNQYAWTVLETRIPTEGLPRKTVFPGKQACPRDSAGPSRSVRNLLLVVVEARPPLKPKEQCLSENTRRVVRQTSKVTQACSNHQGATRSRPRWTQAPYS
jgi:hypothetical protein